MKRFIKTDDAHDMGGTSYLHHDATIAYEMAHAMTTEYCLCLQWSLCVIFDDDRSIVCVYSDHCV